MNRYLHGERVKLSMISQLVLFRWLAMAARHLIHRASNLL